jgi:serine protease Do
MYTNLVAQLLSHSKIAVFSHIRPDGDCLGSQVGVCLWLEQNGVQVRAFNQDPSPENLRWLVDLFPVESPTQADLLEVDAVLFVDGNQLSRFGELAESLAEAKIPLYMIDHHPDPSDIFTDMISVPGASSTCELMYGLYQAHKPDQLIPAACKALYTGLVTDTGSFQFESVTPATLAAASDLLARGGFRPNEIMDALYANKSQGQIALLGKALNTIETHLDGRIASITVTQAMFEATGTGPSDTEGFVKYPLSLEGVMGCVLFREDADRIKVSLRSRTSLDVNGWARKINGGGHAKAAAGWYKAPMEQAKAAVLALGEESVKLTKNTLSSLLLFTMFLAWAVLAGACNGAGQNTEPSGFTSTQEGTVQGQSDLLDEDTYRMGDEVEMNDDSGMRALSPEQRYAEDSEGRRIRGGAIDRSRANAITTAVEKASPAIVSITVTELQTGFAPTRDPFFSFFFEQPVQREVQSMGSGFIISADGLIVTNEHVANPNAKTIMVTLPNGSSYEAEILGSDELADLALLKIQSDTTEFPYVEFAPTDDLMAGEWAIAMGNPFGLFADGQPTVTVGVISATKRDFRPDPQEPRVYIDMIQTDAAINRGNSGGPLVNSNGEVIGVNTFIFTGGTSNGFVGLGFAIPSERVQKIIEQLKDSGEVQLAFDTGMEFTPMTRGLVRQYGLPPVPGLFVLSVNRNGPAYESGVLPGDIIMRIGKDRVASQMHAFALMREYDEGDLMPIRLFREGKEYETEMLLRRKVLN